MGKPKKDWLLKKYGKMSLVDKLSVFLMVLIVVIVLTMQTIRYNQLSHHANYTVGITTGMHYGGQSAKYVRYYFKLGEDIYGGSCSMYLPVNTKGGKYVVAYYRENPKKNLLLLDHPLPDSFDLGMMLDTLSPEDVYIPFMKF